MVGRDEGSISSCLTLLGWRVVMDASLSILIQILCLCISASKSVVGYEFHSENNNNIQSFYSELSVLKHYLMSRNRRIPGRALSV